LKDLTASPPPEPRSKPVRGVLQHFKHSEERGLALAERYVETAQARETASGLKRAYLSFRTRLLRGILGIAAGSGAVALIDQVKKAQATGPAQPGKVGKAPKVLTTPLVVTEPPVVAPKGAKPVKAKVPLVVTAPPVVSPKGAKPVKARKPPVPGASEPPT